MKRSAYLYVALVVLALIVGLVWVHIRSAPIPDRATRAHVAYWKTRIATVGPARAYSEFAVALKDAGPDEQHGDAHVFGSALYAEVGVAGMRTCDAQFSYGCYHELVGEAIAGHGLAIVSELQKDCSGSVGCEHGIGHGLVGSLGYTPDALQRAVRACEQMVPGQIDGCEGGAFMEYNMRTLAGAASSTSSIRPIGESGLLAPCMSFSGSAQESCALLQPQWWSQVLSDSEHLEGSALFKRIGALCVAFSDAQAYRTCFEGSGWIAASLAYYVPKDIDSLCDAATRNARGRLYCRSFGAQLFPSVGLPVTLGEQVCDGLAPGSKEYCVAYAQGSADIGHPAALPTELSP